MNDSRTTQPRQALDQALEMGGLGYKIIPIPSGEKFPKGLREWQKRATNAEAQITDWWGKGEAGIGWAMGLQPNGATLVAIDVDVSDGKPGKANFEAFAAEHDLSDALRSTVMSVTGSGGFHFVFTLPDGVTMTNGILMPGVDIRGEGGFIVIPPSIHPNGKRYRWAREGSEPWSIAPGPCPEPIIQLSLHEKDDGDDGDGDGDYPQRVHVSTVPRETSDETPADFIRRTAGIGQMLSSAGWTYIENKGQDSYWARPGKSPRDGHSAVLHDEGPLVIWSTSAPMEFWRVGRDNPDGSRSLSPFEVYAAIEHSGDTGRAGSHVRRNMMERASGPASGGLSSSAPEAGDGQASQPVTVEPLNLPDEFWEARPWLQHIRQAAWARLVSPDATLIGVLARFAALVPPTLRIPPIIGSDSTFDFIGCVVASSSGGKTISNQVANQLIVTGRTDVLLGMPIGSGEGLVQAFMADELDDDGKKTGTQSYKLGPKAVHFTVDEGTALMEQQNRKGTTIIQTLCSAWSGATLGQMNASKETHRIVPEKQRRVSCVINMQTSNGHLLLEEHVIAVGLPQRIVFATAHDASIPDELPEWPGELDWPMLPSIAQPHVLEYAPEIVSLLQNRRREVVRGNLVQGALEGHSQLQQLKVAGLMELLSGGQIVSWETWELAGMVISSSAAVREQLAQVKKEADFNRTVTQGTQAAYRELAAEDVKERQKIDRLADAIAAKVTTERVALGALRKMVTSSETRHRFEPALDMAIARGVVQADATHVWS